jgi:uncharacterized protein (DUF1015 family)
MADVAGFRAVGFADKVPLERAVAPADVESAAERERCAALDPHNAVRLADPTAAAAGPALADPIAEWLGSGVLRQDGGRALYRYHQEYTLPDLGGRTLTRRGLLCAVRLPSLADNGIKLHQAVREAEVTAHTELMGKLNIHAAPVMAAYRDPAVEVDRLFRKLELGPPTFQVQTPDGTWHRIWRCGDAEIIGTVRHFFAPRRLYILDGHERLAAMQAVGARLAEREASMPMYAAGNYVTMCLVNLEDQALLPAPVHRLLGGSPISQADVLARAARYFSVTKLSGLAQSPARLAKVMDEWTATQACFALAFPGSPDVWQLTMLPAVNPRDEGVEGHPLVTRLDPWVIEELFLRRVLGKPGAAVVTATPSPPAAAVAAPAAAPIAPAAEAAPAAAVAPAVSEGSAATEATAVAPQDAARPAVEAAAGEWPVAIVHDATAALAALAAGKGTWMAVLSRPVPMTQVVHVADLGQELPPRSTHFAPHLLAGLAMLRLTADEDLV